MPNINGTSGDDSLTTAAGASVVHGLGGNDYITDSWLFSDYADELYGDEGNDTIYARGGNDLLFGGSGDDVLNGSLGADTLDGGDDNDYLTDYDAGGDTLRGGAGDDEIYVSHTASANPLGPIGSLTTIEGGTGSDRITLNYARTAQTLIDAGEGDDYVLLKRFGGTASVTLGAGSDTIELHRDFGGWPFTGVHITDYAAEDRIIGLSEALFYGIGPWDGVANPFGTGQLRLRQSGADTLLERNFLGTGDAWTTILIFDNTDAASLTAARLDGFDPTGAAAPAQTLDGGAAGEALYGGQGDDVIHGNDGDDILTGNAGNDALYGGDGDDKLVGGVGTDLLDGGAGNDDFNVTANGADTVIGGDGDDTLFYRRDDRNFSGWPIAGGTSHIDMGEGNDRLTIHQFSGEIVVDAGAGNDTVVTVGYGYRLTLGAGADEIQVSSIVNTMTVTDFNPAEDRVSSIRSLFPSSWSYLDDPYATGVIRLVQQGADTAVQITTFPAYPFGQTRFLLLGVDARSLNAANLGGYAPDGIWAFGTSANDTLAGGSGKDRLSDDQGGADSLDGGAGNDILSWSRTSGGSGTSSLVGGAGEDRIDLRGGNASTVVHADGGADNDDVHLANITGRALITLGDGQDKVTLDALASMLPGTGASVTDFAAGAGGDALAINAFLAGWLTGWNGTDNPFATGHARLAQSGAATLLQFDRDGGGDSWATALVLDNVNAASLTAANLDGWDSGTLGNQAPTLAAGPGTPSSYFEGGGALPILPSATLYDGDSPDFSGAVVRVTLAGAVADDLVAIRGDGFGGIAVSGGSVSYLGTAIGTVGGGAGAQNLVVNLNGSATEAAVQALVRNITYAGTTDAMLGGERILTVSITDGDGGAAQIVTQLSAYALNDAPTIAGIDGDVAHFVEGGAPVRLDVGAAALVADADSPNFGGGTLRVAITAGGNPLQDMLEVQSGGHIGVFGNQIAFDGFTFASAQGGWPGSDLVLTFNDTATPTKVAALIQALSYRNFDTVTPSAATRTLTLTLTDGDGTQYGGADTRVATVQVEVEAINEAPVISPLIEPITYHYEGGSAGLFAGVYIGDAEFRAGYGGGSLTVSVDGTGAIQLPYWSTFHAVAAAGGFDLFYVNGGDPAILVGRIAGLGTASVVVDSFAAAPPNVFSYLASAFAYAETGDAPSAASRTATLTFNDGGNGNGVGAQSASRTQTIQMVAQNDAPVVTLASGASATYAVNAAPLPVFAGVAIADPDQPASFSGGWLEAMTGGIGAGFALTGSRFAIDNSGGGEAILDSFTGLQIGTMSRGPGTMTVALTGGATPEAVTALARSIGFVAAGQDASLGARNASITLHDGGNDGAGGSLASNYAYVMVNVVDWLAGTPGNDLLNGGPGLSYLIGLGGDDTLVGNAVTSSTLQGGPGNDWYYVSRAGDSIVEFAGEGSDRVVASVSFALSAGQEIETLVTADPAGTAALRLTGNALAQIVYGNAGANVLSGGGGSDYLIGLAGDDILIGNADAASTLQGGTGNDSYYVSLAGDSIIEAAGEGNDRILTTVGYVLSAGREIETLSALDPTGTAAIDLAGNALGQFIQGTNGANTLTGGGGADYLLGLGGDDILFGNADAASTLQGGTGNDWYYVSRTGDSIIEAAGQGNDRVLTGVSYTLSAGQEIETLSAAAPSGNAAIDLAGNGFAQFIQGTNGANVLAGNGGADQLSGLGGSDVLLGGDGGDILNGGAAGDVLNGGAGADLFVFADALGPANVDAIQDFVSGSDEILLDRTMFAGLSAGDLPADAFVVGTAPQDAGDRILYDAATGNLYFDADGTGAAAAIQFATLSGHPVIAASDFSVI